LDLDMNRAAKLLIDQHGDHVGVRAAGRTDELLERGDTDLPSFSDTAPESREAP
jgi:hypothetical protein